MMPKDDTREINFNWSINNFLNNSTLVAHYKLLINSDDLFLIYLNSTASIRYKTSRCENRNQRLSEIWVRCIWKSTTVNLLDKGRLARAHVSRQHLRSSSCNIRRNTRDKVSKERRCWIFCLFSIQCCWIGYNQSIFRSEYSLLGFQF